MDEVIHLTIFLPEISGSSYFPSLNPMPILPWTLLLGLRGKWKKYLCIVIQCDHYYYEHPFMIIRGASLMIWLMYKREKMEIIGGGGQGGDTEVLTETASNLILSGFVSHVSKLTYYLRPLKCYEIHFKLSLLRNFHLFTKTFSSIYLTYFVLIHTFQCMRTCKDVFFK